MIWKFGRRRTAAEPGTIGGPARLDGRTKNLTKRLGPGEVAVIDHEDIDRVSAESLIACQPVAILNAASSTSGRYPNLGPGILLSAGIPLIDDLGSAIMDIREGDQLRIEEDGSVYRGDDLIAEGQWVTEELNDRRLEDSRSGMAVQLAAFAHNTMEYVEKEQDLILNSVGVPDIATNLEDRQVLIAVRGYNYKSDLEALSSYIRDYRPVLIGVDGGADALLELGFTPELIVGDMDSVSDQALTSGAEIVVHAYRDGRAPGVARLEELGVGYLLFPMTGTSEDVAMLLADAKGARLIVAVGTHSTLVEFLDKGREGMASTFLTRLKLGGKLIDAKGASQLYQSRISTWQLLALIVAGLIAFSAAMSATAAGQTLANLAVAWFQDVAGWFTSLLR